MYRHDTFDPVVRQQVFEACEVLRDWKKHEPAIAGGSLWSWAANRPARDVDVFVKNSIRARRKASSYILNSGGSNLNVMVSNYWGRHVEPVKAVAYTSMLSVGCPLDIVLTPVSGIKALKYFDYEHCMVAFGLDKVDLSGAECYVGGTLNQKHDRARTQKVIMKKIQRSLWGYPDAETKLKEVIYDLKRIVVDQSF